MAIYVDLDGTLAHYDDWVSDTHIGDPIPKMKSRVLHWLREGKEVVIFTARANSPTRIHPIEDWLVEHGFGRLRITNIKGPEAEEFWDDRAVGVEKNTGKIKGS